MLSIKSKAFYTFLSSLLAVCGTIAGASSSLVSEADLVPRVKVDDFCFTDGLEKKPFFSVLSTPRRSSLLATRST